MKKTLTIAALALGLCSAASAAVIAPSLSYTEFTGVDQTVVVGDTTYSYHSGSYGYAPVFNADGSATFTNDILNIYASSGTADMGCIGGTGTTITMTISGLNYGTASDAGNHAIFTTTSGTTKWGLGLNSDGKITGTWGDNTYPTSGTVPAFDVPEDIFILSATINRNNTSIYINGELVGSVSGLCSSNNNAIAYLMVGSEASSRNAGADMTVHNLFIHNTALDADEVAAFVASIPEPATASLSLLGLAALAMRRRRA